jgi:DNA-directed RNA polymerase subunit RPC12/RpoP
MARRGSRATIDAMAVIACDACSGKMNDGLMVCPHCGARRALTERPRLSGDEIRALLATDQTVRAGEPRGLIQTLILPHPATRGVARLAEVALTVVGLPLVISGAVSLGLTRRARLTAASGGELPAALLMTVFGGAGLLGLPVAVVGASLAAVWLRALIRSRAAGRRVDLHRIEPPPREPLAPPVIVDPAPAPPAPLASPRASEPPGQPGEPRLLR